MKTKAQWLLDCGWILGEDGFWFLMAWPIDSHDETAGVDEDTAIRIQTATIEAEARELYRLVYAKLADPCSTLANGEAQSAVRSYLREYLPTLTDEAP